MKKTLSKKNAEKLASISENSSTNWEKYESLQNSPIFVNGSKKNKK